MKTLEQLAEELFNIFTTQEIGTTGHWKYLSKARKIAWMEEVLVVSDRFIDALQQDLKPLTLANRYDTTYIQGFYAGKNEERTQFIEKVHQIKVQLKEELEQFKLEK